MFKRVSVVWLLLGLALLVAGCPNSGEPETTTSNTSTAGNTGTDPAQPTPPPTTNAAWTGDAFDFMYTSFSGGQGKASEFAGKPLVVNFWAAW